MCRSIAEGGRRCLPSLIEELRKKEEELARGMVDYDNSREKEEEGEELTEKEKKKQDDYKETKKRAEFLRVEIPKRQEAQRIREMAADVRRLEQEERGNIPKAFVKKSEADLMADHDESLLTAQAEIDKAKSQQDKTGFSEKASILFTDEEWEELAAELAGQGVSFSQSVRAAIRQGPTFENRRAADFVVDADKFTEHKEKGVSGRRPAKDQSKKEAKKTVSLTTAELLAVDAGAARWNCSRANFIRRLMLKQDPRKAEGDRAMSVHAAREKINAEMEAKAGFDSTTEPRVITEYFVNDWKNVLKELSLIPE